MGVKVLTIVGNCTDEATIVASFKTIYDEFGFIDVLMNNVGQTSRERASEFYKSTPDVRRFVIDVTLMSTLLASRQVVPSMRDAGRGKIVNVASNAGMAGEIGISEYAAAKMGVIGFTRSLAGELAPFKVNVNPRPGVTKTRVIDRISDEILDKIRASIPLASLRSQKISRRQRHSSPATTRIHDRPIRRRRRWPLDDLKDAIGRYDLPGQT